MMNNAWHNLLTFLRAAHLHDDERQAMRSSLARQFGLPVSAPAARAKLWQWLPIWVAAAFIVVIISTGGIAFAAEQSLPGDFLYGWKLGVNEQLRDALNVTAESQGNWFVRGLERRAEEAEALVASGQLTEKRQAQLEENFARFDRRSSELIARIGAAGHHQTAAQLSSNVEAALSAHQRILAALNAQSSGTGVFAGSVQTAASAAAAAREEHEASVTAGDHPNVQTAATGRQHAVENKIREVEKFIARMKAKRGAAATAEAEVKLAAAKTILADGKVKLAAGAYAEAFRLFQQAHRAAQQAKLFVKTKKEVQTNVNANASVESGTEIKPADPQPEHGQDDNVRSQLNLNISAAGRSGPD
jgi:hypothetical protein